MPVWCNLKNKYFQGLPIPGVLSLQQKYFNGFTNMKCRGETKESRMKTLKKKKKRKKKERERDTWHEKER